ncbi:S-adenosyl-L-methionine-dependent methyltransferase [Gymnopus androsaceus JB14]|uniref:S-adenosyl-L-methionine-dependent methyltransferase n=1 Tax=Gymnopus androsaceus JB14 TaxID=1447944 RepID=A0A6A4IL35_9AGAR|nr:S-adenosyl-L-methionine-dependent methyltransferase [Gymnopus androsaceus JB14]
MLSFQSFSISSLPSFSQVATYRGAIVLVLATCLVWLIISRLTPQLTFFWYCFVSPLAGAKDQKARLDKFYEGQADVYDATRKGLLRGRKTMLNLSAGHLRTLRASNPDKRLVWIDIGGGTGHNIEAMDKFLSISSFDAVYLIDLCEPLLQVARKRFAQKGWTNVHILCQDASNFVLPEWQDGVDPKGSVGFVTLSYSLSMIPNFYTLLDRLDYVLSPQDGLLGVVDFYTAGKNSSLHEKAIGGDRKECGWLSRYFWLIWFDFDNVHLSPARRDYLEYKFGTVKSYNGRNRFVLPFIVRIPYYIWLGRPRTADVSKTCHAFEIEGGNTVGNCSPNGSFKVVRDAELSMPPLELGSPVIDQREEKQDVVINITPPLSSFHYQVNKPWRLPYYQHPVHKEFRTFIYSFTWEDPYVDVMHLELTKDDSMFVITSAGDNALHYAIAARPRRIHCVDMNPCQGHLLELKLAAIQSLDYADFFALFGNGYHVDFRFLLDSKIAPNLSSSAYQFWRINSEAFTTPSKPFYLHGYSGWALRLARVLRKDVERLCECETLDEQVQIWQQKLRPLLLNPIIVALMRNPVFCWNALGVPMNQRRMLLNEGSVYEYVRDTLDPLLSTYLLKTDNYFYLLCLLGHYTHASCPAYLTRPGFEALKANKGKTLDAFRLHTDSIYNVLCGLNSSSLTRSLIMDHLDWFTPASKDVDDEVAQLARVTSPGGFVFWRSAARYPWYNKVFERSGFRVEPVGVRKGSEIALDKVNMYASFWKATRV